MEEQPLLPTPAIQQPEEQPQAEEEQPTKSVDNFWERLDAVFKQNNDMKEKFDELLQNFPSEVKPQGEFRSFIFQPERILISSNDDITAQILPSNLTTQGGVPSKPDVCHSPAEQYSQFRIRLQRPLRNVKSIQLLSAVIPNAITSIPDNSVFFFYYKLRSVALANKGVYNNATAYQQGDIVSFNALDWVARQSSTNVQPTGQNIGTYWVQITLPADQTRPNYYELRAAQAIKYFYLTPTYWWPYEFTANNTQNFYNRTFADYQDLVTALNYITSQNNLNNNEQSGFTFSYDATLNKILMIPSDAQIAAGYYYLPMGYADRNPGIFMRNANNQIYFNTPGNIGIPANLFSFTEGYLLNTRLGFTWNGIYPNPYTLANPWADTNFLSVLYWYLRKRDPGFNNPYNNNWTNNQITCNSYPDLVNTSCLRINADFTLGSTEDSLGSTSRTGQGDGLLSVVPINATNLGVGFYQNNFNNPLTKIPQNIAEIGISMLTDQGLPFYLPNSATVLLELGITYH